MGQHYQQKKYYLLNIPNLGSTQTSHHDESQNWMPSHPSAYKIQQNKVWNGLACGKVSCGPVVHTKHNTETDNIIKSFCSVFGKQTLFRMKCFVWTTGQY